MEWGNVILSLMEEHRISQRRLSVASGISRSTIRRLLHGDFHVQIETLERVLDAFGYSLDCLKSGEPSQSLQRAPLATTARPPRRKLIRAVGSERRY